MEQESVQNNPGGAPLQTVPSKPQLTLLEKYLPWVRYADTVIETLQTLGLAQKQITAVLMGEDLKIMGELVNPEDLRPLMIPEVTVSVKVKDGGRTCLVLLDGKPVQRYFQEYYEKEILLKKAAGQNEVVAQLYEENLEMRRLLGGKARTYK